MKFLLILTLFFVFSCGEETTDAGSGDLGAADNQIGELSIAEGDACSDNEKKSCDKNRVLVCSGNQSDLKWQFDKLCEDNEVCNDGNCEEKTVKSPSDTSCEPGTPRCDVEVKGCDPEEEICDGKDNDCDGDIDEELVKDCVGCAGQSSGISQCKDGAWTACPDIQPQNASISVNFPAPKSNCLWSRNGNLDANGGGRISARAEQRVRLNLPQGVILCSLELSSKTKDFYYDDELLLAFNDFVLFESVDFSKNFQAIDGLKKYDWAKIVGKQHGPSGPFCAGKAISCKIPGTQSSGQVDVSYDTVTNQKLMALAKSKGSYELNLVVTGDNDEDPGPFQQAI